MTHSFGHPQAFAIYFEIMDRFKRILDRLTAVVKLISKKG